MSQGRRKGQAGPQTRRFLALLRPPLTADSAPTWPPLAMLSTNEKKLGEFSCTCASLLRAVAAARSSSLLRASAASCCSSVSAHPRALSRCACQAEGGTMSTTRHDKGGGERTGDGEEESTRAHLGRARLLCCCGRPHAPLLPQPGAVRADADEAPVGRRKPRRVERGLLHVRLPLVMGLRLGLRLVLLRWKLRGCTLGLI